MDEGTLAEGTIVLPDCIVEIGDWAFLGCAAPSVTLRVVVPENVAWISSSAVGEDDRIVGEIGGKVQHYAMDGYMAFEDIKTGRVIRYDLIGVRQEEIQSLSAGTHSIRLTYKKFEEASYRIAVKKEGGGSWKKYDRSKTSVKIGGLKKGTYRVKVRAMRTIDGTRYFGKWSSVKTVQVK